MKLRLSFSRASLRALLAFAAFGTAVAAYGQFYETLAWDKQVPATQIGTPGAGDVDIFGDEFVWTAIPSGGNTNCYMTSLTDGGGVTQSGADAFTGTATALLCRWTPDLNVYVAGTYDGSPSTPTALYLARCLAGGGPSWQIELGGPGYSGQVPIALSSDSSYNANMVVRVSDGVHANPYLSFLQVNKTSSIIDWYGTDAFINPSAAVATSDKWFVAGSDNNAGDLGGARWAVYTNNNLRIAGNYQDNVGLDNAGDWVEYSYVVAPAANDSFVVAQNATTHYVSNPTKQNTSHVFMVYNPSGTLVAKSASLNGKVIKIVNQGSYQPTYAFEYDGGTMQSAGTPMLYQFKNDMMGLNWRVPANAQFIIPDSAGVYVGGGNTAGTVIYGIRFSSAGKVLWSTGINGNKPGGTSILRNMAVVNEKLFFESSLTNETGGVEDFRRWVTGAALTTVSGPTSVTSGQSITLSYKLTEPTQQTLIVNVGTGAQLVMDGSYHSVDEYLTKGTVGGSITVKALKVTKPTKCAVIFSADEVTRTYVVTVNP